MKSYLDQDCFVLVHLLDSNVPKYSVPLYGPFQPLEHCFTKTSVSLQRYAQVGMNVEMYFIPESNYNLIVPLTGPEEKVYAILLPSSSILVLMRYLLSLLRFHKKTPWLLVRK
jgi:hypothetical protein